MKQLLLYTIGFLIVSISATAQSAVNKDSLLQVLKTAKEDSNMVNLLLKINAAYNNDGHMDSGLLYLEKAQQLAEKKNLTAFIPRINTAYIQYYYNNSNYNKSKEYALKNLAIAEKNHDDVLMAKAYNNLTAVYNHFGNYKQAVDYSLKCLALSEKLKDSINFAARYATVSNTYLNLKQNDKTIFYSKKAIELALQFDQKEELWAGLNNIGSGYSGQHKMDSAIYFGMKQLDFAKKENYTEGIIYASINLSYRYFLNGDLQGVEKTLAILNEFENQTADTTIIAEMYVAKALAHILKGNYTPAKMLLDSSIGLAIKVKAESALGNAYNTYAKLYFMQNKVKEAENYAYRYDSLQSVANLKELNFYIEDLGVQYETEKKETQIKLQQSQLKQRSILNYFLATGIFALLLIFLLGYRNYRNRQKLQQSKIDELESEKKLTATEAVLKGEEQERTRLAKDLHDGLGGMLSGIKYSLTSVKENLVMTPGNAQAFERSIDMLDSSIKEMRRVAHNMMPEILIKYGLDTALKEFCSEIDHSGVIHVNYQSVGMQKAVIEQTTAVTIYRMVQELVNNTIKHARAENILVQLHQSAQEKLLAITIEDDGQGFDTSILNQPGGLGWQSIKNRVDFLKGKVDIQSSAGKGTSVMIEIII
ncbi:tetratricopeptide repeat-containing sensor histidine kinase [Ferruginibacter profundus]